MIIPPEGMEEEILRGGGGQCCMFLSYYSVQIRILMIRINSFNSLFPPLAFGDLMSVCNCDCNHNCIGKLQQGSNGHLDRGTLDSLSGDGDREHLRLVGWEPRFHAHAFSKGRQDDRDFYPLNDHTGVWIFKSITAIHPVLSMEQSYTVTGLVN